MEGPSERIDPRARRTRAAIREAFEELIVERESRSITVAELTRRAGISRKTFYLHYETIEALYEDMIHDLLEAEARTFGAKVLQRGTQAVNEAFFRRWANAEPWEERMLCHPSYAFICDEVMLRSYRRNIALNNPFRDNPPETQELICDYLISTSLHFYRTWVAQGKRMPLDQLIEVTGRLLERGLSAFK